LHLGVWSDSGFWWSYWGHKLGGSCSVGLTCSWLVDLFSKISPNLACKNWSALILSNHWCVFILKVAWSGWDTGGLHATFGLKIAPVVAENKSRPIWGWSIQPKRTVSGRVSCTDHLSSRLASLLDSAACTLESSFNVGSK
jgi:hypothetical protein